MRRPRTRLGQKIFLTFVLVIALPITGLASMLAGLSGRIEAARIEDRFGYAEDFVYGTFEGALRTAESRLRQLTLDSRFRRAVTEGPAAAETLVILLGEYGLDSLFIEAGAGRYGVGRPAPAVSAAAADPIEAAIYGRYGAFVDREGVSLYAGFEYAPGAHAVASRRVERSQLEAILGTIEAGLDFYALAAPGYYALSTRRDGFGQSLSGQDRPGPHEAPTAAGYLPRALILNKALALPPPLAAAYSATATLRKPSSAVSEAGAYIIAFAIAALLLAGAASVILSRQIALPLDELLSAARALAREPAGRDLQQPLTIRARDELGELASAFNALAAETAEAHADLRRRNASLKQLADLKDEFLNASSTELRAPVNEIAALAESLLALGGLGDDARRTAALVAAKSKRLYAMVADLLDYSRLQHGDIRISPRPFELKAVVDLVMRYAAVMKAESVELLNLVEPELYLIADPIRTEQILYNLVERSAHATAKGAVSVRCERTGDAAKIVVSDTGRALYAGELDRAFEPAPPGARRGGPAGLELPIAKRLIELHGSELRDESVPGGETILTFTLPLADPAARLAEAGANPSPSTSLEEEVDELLPVEDEAPAEAAPAKAFAIIIVDDDPVMPRILMNGLRPDFELAWARDASSALGLLRAGGSLPDLMLIAAMLPGLSGYELAAALRKDHGPADLPIVIMTERSRAGDAREAFAAGANDVIAKPISLLELKSRLRLLGERYRLEAALDRSAPSEHYRELGLAGPLEARPGDAKPCVAALLAVRLGLPATPGGGRELESEAASLNERYSRLDASVRRRHGSIESFSGREALAVFIGSASEAMEAAREALAELVPAGAGAEAHDGARISFGLHRGPALAAWLGNERRLQLRLVSSASAGAYALARRAEELGRPILASAEAIEALPGGRWRFKYVGTDDLAQEGVKAYAALED